MMKEGKGTILQVENRKEQLRKNDHLKKRNEIIFR